MRMTSGSAEEVLPSSCTGLLHVTSGAVPSHRSPGALQRARQQRRAGTWRAGLGTAELPRCPSCWGGPAAAQALACEASTGSEGSTCAELMQRLGLQRRVYTAGRSKVLLDPFRQGQHFGASQHPGCLCCLSAAESGGCCAARTAGRAPAFSTAGNREQSDAHV